MSTPEHSTSKAEKRKVAAVTFGCKVNQYETACILDDFVKADYQIVDFDERASVYIINSCTVTNRTDYKSRNAIRKALKRKDDSEDTVVIVTGCYAQRHFEEVKKLGEIDLIVDNAKKDKIFSFLREKKANFEAIALTSKFADMFTNSMLERTRAFVKIQDGCDFYCAYCAIPFARGRPRSRTKASVLKQIDIFVQNGFKEIVLTGINLGLYGRDLSPNYTLNKLIRDIDKVGGIELIRLSSVEPQCFADELIDICAESPKICPHFHIPLQSGADKLLKNMRRDYSIAQFEELISKIKKKLPSAAIGLDLIVGLPGESEKEYNQTYSFVESLPIAYLHTFAYSKRPGTAAAKFSDQVSGDIIKKRSKQLLELSDEKTVTYINELLDSQKKIRGIIENRARGHFTALSDHYIRLYTKSGSKAELVEGTPEQRFYDGVLIS